jgi:hypothetical protein
MATAASRLTVALMLTAGLAGLSCQAGIAKQTKPNQDPSALVKQRIREWDITAAERRFDEIGWTHTIRDAERLAKEHHRPVFLFTHDGRMAVGRC